MRVLFSRLNIRTARLGYIWTHRLPGGRFHRGVGIMDGLQANRDVARSQVFKCSRNLLASLTDKRISQRYTECGRWKVGARDRLFMPPLAYASMPWPARPSADIIVGVSDAEAVERVKCEYDAGVVSGPYAVV